MFSSRRYILAGAGGYALRDVRGGTTVHHGAALLGQGAQLLDDAQVLVYRRVLSLGERFAEWRERGFRRRTRIELACDLGRNIGSGQWFRGVGTLLGLSAAALAFWPDFAPLEAAQNMAIDDTARDEFRSQRIAPLALGADTGRYTPATKAVIPLKAAPERPRLELVATMAPSDSFARMLLRAGVGTGDAGQVNALVGAAVPLAGIQPGTKVDIVMGKRPAPGEERPLDALKFRARFDMELAITRQAGRLVMTPQPIRVDTTPLRIRGTVGGSLYRSARNAGVPAHAVQQYLRALAGTVDFDRGLGAGDTFDIVLAYKRAETGESQAGDLLYAGLEQNGKARAQLLRWGNQGQFFEASGGGESRSGLMMPVNGQMGSPFGMRRHPILGYMRMHKGMDFRVGYGAPIFAATDGRVVFAGRHGGHGNFVKLDHGGGLGTGYAHMSRIAVNNGAYVRRGQVIGYVGSTGLSTGPHLHYEMYRNGQVVNPVSVRYAVRSQLEGGELAAFRTRLASLKAIKPGAALNALVPTMPDAASGAAPAREIARLDTMPRMAVLTRD